MKTLFAKSMLIASAIGMLGLTSCNDDDEKVASLSKEEIKELFSSGAGEYIGEIAEFMVGENNGFGYHDVSAYFNDSLIINLPTKVIASTVSDDFGAASYLLREETIRVAAAYEFLSNEYRYTTFKLHPTTVVLPAGYGAPPQVKIVFSQEQTGNMYPAHYINDVVFLATEVWVNGQKEPDFKPVKFTFNGPHSSRKSKSERI